MKVDFKKQQTVSVDFDECMEASYEALKEIFECIKKGELLRENHKRINKMLIWLELLKDEFKDNRERSADLAFLEAAMLRNKILIMEAKLK